MFIELDRRDQAECDPAPSPRPPLRHRARPWAAALVAVALLAFGSADGEPRPTLRHVTDIAVKAEAELTATDQNLLITEPGTLTAFDPKTAKLRWRVQTGLRQQLVSPEGDLLVISGSGGVSGADPTGAATMAVTAANGEVRWRIPGYLQRTGGYMVAHEISYSPAPVGRMTVYDRAAQRLWSAYPVAPLHSFDEEHQTVFTVEPTSGEVVEYRLDNGSVISRTVLPELIGVSAIYRSGEELVANFPDGSSIYRRGSTFVTPPNENPVVPIDVSGYLREEQYDCGSVWCVYSSFGPGILLKDKATGEVVLRDEHWVRPIRTDFGVIGMRRGTDRDAQVVLAFDSVTRRHRVLTGWSLLGIQPGPVDEVWHGPVFLVSSAQSRTFFAFLDGTGMHIAGSVPHEHLLQCHVTTDLVACRVDPQTIKVWHPVV
jgi:hypothetical protein